jgi:hypothetical protein
MKEDQASWEADRYGLPTKKTKIVSNFLPNISLNLGLLIILTLPTSNKMIT